jgi:hypothetical protein
LLSALNIILAKHAANSGGVRVGRDRYFFKGLGGSMDIGGGLEAWKVFRFTYSVFHLLELSLACYQGFYSSVRPTVNNLMENVNVCYTAFYKVQNLAYALEEFERASFGANPGKFVEGIRVQPTHVRISPSTSTILIR